jgi:hypothetical protein
MPIEIREHQPGGDVGPFIEAGHVVFAGDKNWVPPLNFEIKERLDPKKNPFFNRGECILFTAWNNGKLVGRASAQVDREHLNIWNDQTGFFGFFDTVDDEEVARALIEAAKKWLRAKGMKRMLGPMSLYVNEEMGVLVEGFDTPPMLMMAHSREYQGALAEKAGLQKEKDLWAWRFKRGEISKRALKAWEDIKKLPEVKLRSVDTSRMEEEIATIIDIYNDAWKGKWCFVPAMPDEAKKMAADMKLIIDRDLAFMAEVNGKTAGMCIMLPNLNEAIADLEGKLFPFGFAKLLYRVKVSHPKTCRLMMLGIKSEIRANMKRYGGLSAAMYVEVAKRGMAKGYEWAELSWTREDDGPINAGIRIMGADVYKKYRVYQTAL